MDLELLRYFVVTAEMQHVTKAANALHITQPALSSALKRLEGWVGLPLFEKDGRGIRLTDHAHDYYNNIKLALNLIDEANSKIEKAQQDMERTLKVFAPSLFNYPDLAESLLLKYPTLQFSHVGISYTELIDALKKQKLDFAICWAYYLDPDLTSEVLMVREICVYASPKNPYYNREEITLEELNTLTFVGPRANEATMDHMNTLMTKYGIKPPSFIHVTSIKDQLEAVKSFGFVTLQPDDIVQNYPGEGMFKLLRVKEISPICESLYLIYNSEQQKPICRDVCALITEYFRGIK